jgi:hypothetical protein
LRDLAWSQVFPRDPGLLQPWIPGTRPGTNPGMPSKLLSSLYNYSPIFLLNVVITSPYPNLIDIITSPYPHLIVVITSPYPLTDF